MWKVEVLTEPTLNAVGEAQNPHELTVTYGLSRMRTCRFRLDRFEEVADAIAANVDLAVIRVIDEANGGVTRFIGPVTTVEEIVGPDGPSMLVNCADAFWRLSRRVVAVQADGNLGLYPSGFNVGTPANPLNRKTSAVSLIRSLQTNGPNGLTPSGLTANYGATTGIGNAYIPPGVVRVSDAIQLLATALDGFDWHLVDREPPYTELIGTAGKPQSLVISEMVIAATLGVTTPTAAFEFGFGKHNLTSYRRLRSSDQIANSMYGTYPDANGVSVPVILSTDFASLDARGAFDDVLQPSGISTFAPLVELAKEQVRIRKVPRETITFQPVRELNASRVPRFKVDYDVGDLVTFQAQHAAADRIGLVNMRVYGVSVSFDGGGNPTPTVTLVADA